MASTFERAVFGTLLVALLMMGCGERAENSLLRFEGRGYESDALRTTLAERRGAINPAQARKLVGEALWILEQRLYAASRPIADEEQTELERRVRWSQLRDCADLAVKRQLATLDIQALAKELFDRDPDRYAIPETCALQMIFIPSPTPGVRQVAEELLAEVQRDPQRFGELALEHSQSVSAQSGGFSPEMPLNTLHPLLQGPVRAHAGSREPFLVEIDRGCYVLRVVRYSEAVKPVFIAVGKRVVQEAGKQAEDDLFAKAAKAVASDGDVVFNEEVVRIPLVAGDDVVCHVGEIGLTLREILPPSARIGDGLSGPQVRYLMDQYRRMEVFAKFFGCDSATAPEPTPEERGVMRLPEVVRAFAREKMRSEVEDFYSRQAEVFRNQTGFRFDLVALPFHSNDPYAEFLRQQPVVAQVRSATSVSRLETIADDSLVVADLALTEAQVMAYEPLLLGVLQRLQPGAWSDPVFSPAVESLLLARLIEMTPAEAFDLTVEKDFNRVLDAFLIDQREEVDAAFRRRVEPLFEINTAALERFIEEYAAPALVGVEAQGTPADHQP